MSEQSPASQGARLSLVLGGARSGKSRYAEALILALPAPWAYVATAQALDDEMTARIGEHRSRRGTHWHTIEEPFELARAITAAPPAAPVLVDCLTLWLSNLILADREIDSEIEHLEQALAARTAPAILVSNEVGFGIVPDNALTRRFRDHQGRLNQRIAAQADRVVLVVAGLPMFLKGQP